MELRILLLGYWNYDGYDAHVGAVILVFAVAFGGYSWWVDFDSIHRLDRIPYLLWYLGVLGGGPGILAATPFAIMRHFAQRKSRS